MTRVTKNVDFIINIDDSSPDDVSPILYSTAIERACNYALVWAWRELIVYMDESFLAICTSHGFTRKSLYNEINEQFRSSTRESVNNFRVFFIFIRYFIRSLSGFRPSKNLWTTLRRNGKWFLFAVGINCKYFSSMYRVEGKVTWRGCLFYVIFTS